LALLLVLCKHENKERENTKPSGKSLEDQSNLEKAFAALHKIYKPYLMAHQAEKCAVMNKKHCMPLLD
jgi:hypothetical protein